VIVNNVLCEQEAVAAGVTLNGQMCNAVLQGFGSDVEVRILMISFHHIVSATAADTIHTSYVVAAATYASTLLSKHAHLCTV
jgi:hypothetical protein